MPYLSQEIERLIKNTNSASLVRKQYSCGIFQEYNMEQPVDKPSGQGPCGPRSGDTAT